MSPEIYARIYFALCIGYLLGIDSERLHKPTRVRDIMFITLLGCVCAIMGLEISQIMPPGADMSSVVYAPIAHLSLLGIVVIMGYIEGITTAGLLLALILAAIFGMLCGLGLFDMACVASLVTYLILKRKASPKEG